MARPADPHALRTPGGASTAANPSAGTRALQALERLLDVQRAALIAGDLTALETTTQQLAALLADAAWQRDAACGPAAPALRQAIGNARASAALAARGESHALRALTALTGRDPLYTARGARGTARPPGPRRFVSA